MPLPDTSQDAVTSIFLFHELPPKVRRITIRECARVLKPDWPAPGSADTELGVLMEPEVSHGKAEVYTRVQA